MATQDIELGPVTNLAGGGEIVVVKPTGVGSELTPMRLPVSEIRAAAQLAGSALQPGDVDEAASLSLAELDARIDLRLEGVNELLEALLGPI